MWVLLSHKLSPTTPSFAAGPSLTITPIKETRTGGSSNSYTVSFPNHLGTHVDAPKHVDDRGKAVADYELPSFFFKHAVVLELRKGASELITAAELERHKGRIAGADILLIRTGFQRFRGSNPERYMTRNPGVSREAAEYIVSSFPDLRAIGFDFISLSAVQNREEGRKAHGALLSGRNFFIVEDMDLSKLRRAIKNLLVIPLFVEGIDSAPCTVLAEV